MTGVALLLFGAAVAFGLARWLRLPSIPLLLLVGMALPVLAPQVDEALFEDAVVLGLTFLLFTAGLELSIRRVGAQRRAALAVGLAELAVVGAAGLLLGLAMGYALKPAVYLALALAASSTLVVVQILKERAQLFEPFGRLVVGVLLLQDLLIILALPAVTRAGDGLLAALAGVGGVLLMLAVALACLRWVIPFIVTRLQREEELLLLTILAILFLFLGLANLLGVPLVAGAFLAGVSMAAFPVSEVVRGLLNSLTDFFLAIFFTALGALVSLPSPELLLPALGFTALIIVLSPLVVAFVAERYYGISARSAIESGLLIAQTSELSLVVALQALAAAHIDRDLFTVIALTTAFTMVLTPLIATDRVTWRLMALYPLRRRRPPVEPPPGGHVVVLGYGRATRPVVERLRTQAVPVVVVDDDPGVVAALREQGIPCLLDDGSNPAALQRAGAPRARAVISNMRRLRDAEVLLQHVRGVPVLVHVFEPAHAERIRALGGTPLTYTPAVADAFLEWFDASGFAAASAEASA